MTLRGAFMAAVVLAGGVLAWQKQGPLRTWWGAQAPLGGSAASSRAALRKCVEGQQVSYTNADCPAGTQQQAVTAAPVNVLPATPMPKAAPAASAPSLLGMERGETLKDKAMERAIDGIR